MPRTESRRWLTGVTLLATLSLATLPAFAAKFPAWATEAISATSSATEAQFDDADAVVLLEEWSIRVDKGARTGHWRRLVKVLTPEGVEEASVQLTNSKLQGFKKIRLWVRGAEGRVKKYNEDDGSLFGLLERKSFGETTLLHVAPPGVRVGSIIALEAVSFNAAELPQDLFALQQTSPVLRAAIAVELRGGWDVVGQSYAVEPAAQHATEETKTWEFRNLDAVTPKFHSAAPEPPGAKFALNYVAPGGAAPFDSWQSTVSWIRELFQPGQHWSQAGERALASQDLEDVSTLQSAGHAARTLRYFNVSLGMGGWIPRPPLLTLERGLGDCKDKVQVMLASLDHLGTPGYPVVIMAPKDGHVADEFPSPFVFNHVVVALPWEGQETNADMTLVDHPHLGRLRLYDPTLSRHSNMDMSVGFAGAPALVIHPDTTGLVRLPEPETTASGLRGQHTWVVGEDGSATAEFEVDARGFTRAFFEGTTGALMNSDELEDITRWLILRLAPEADGVAVDELEARPGGAWSYRGRYNIDRASTASGTLKLLELGPAFVGRNLIPVPEEETPTYVSGAGTWSETVDVQYPDHRYVGTEIGFEISNSVGTVKLEVQPSADGATVTRAIELTDRDVAIGDGPELLELRNGASRLNRVVLLFERTASERGQTMHYHIPLEHRGASSRNVVMHSLTPFGLGQGRSFRAGRW